ncbi:hypothetical protein [Nakamurella deserti]|uniref:hypothetical protein n=1 Tax=Nakamurella deserti TaxID=2164074 RepID=UPI000DBE7E18|nr:hypothetical protein [Nakamurella deserti]
MGPDGPEWPNDVARVADALRAAFPDEFGTARVDVDAGTGTVRFKGEIPAGAAAIAAGVPQVRLAGGAGFSEGDLAGATTTYLAAVHAAFDPARVVVAEADQETGRILVRVGSALDPGVVSAPLTAGEVAAVRAAALAVDPLPPGLSLELEFAADAELDLVPPWGPEPSGR